MDVSQSLNLNTATQHPLFNPTYLNLGYIFNKILQFFQMIFGTGGNGGGSSGGSGGGGSGISFFMFLVFVFGFFFIVMICYCFIRILEIRKKEKAYLEFEIEEYAHHQKEKEKANKSAGAGFLNERWNHVLEYLTSDNESDWKLAIMEADSMLEDLTEQLKLNGENLGERLKAVDKEKFKTLDNAWEAHLTRNKIAHEGSQFNLSQHEANRVITLYENVFREFGYI